MKIDVEHFILYEDEQIIICRKPAGLPVQTARFAQTDMESLLKNHIAAFAASKAHSPSPRRPYLAVIHRLDQPVEGLLVFAKTPKAAKELNRQLTGCGFGKYYYALLSGHPSPDCGRLENYMVRDAQTNTSRVCSRETPGAKKACLSYKTLGICPDSTDPQKERALVEIKLETGRHHQIRVQMAHLGHPLIGDRKYGPAPNAEKNTEPLRLCAYKLCFLHPTSKRKFCYELPVDDDSWWHLV